MRAGIWGLSGILIGLLVALISSGLVLGSFVLSISEAEQVQALPTGVTQVAVSMAALPPLSTTAPPTEAVITPTSSLTATLTSTIAWTATPTATVCPPPSGWVPVDVESGVKVKVIARYYGITEKEFRKANCLNGPGPWLPAWKDQVYVPPPTPAPTATAPYYQPPWPPAPTFPPPPWPLTPFPTDTPIPPSPPPGNVSNSPVPPASPGPPPPTDSSAP